MNCRIESESENKQAVYYDLIPGQVFAFKSIPDEVVIKVGSARYVRLNNSDCLLGIGDGESSPVVVLMPASVDKDGTIVFRRVNND